MENINWKIVGGSANNMWKIPISCGKYQYHGGYCHINWKIADVMVYHMSWLTIFFCGIMCGVPNLGQPTGCVVGVVDSFDLLL